MPLVVDAEGLRSDCRSSDDRPEKRAKILTSPPTTPAERAQMKNETALNTIRRLVREARDGPAPIDAAGIAVDVEKIHGSIHKDVLAGAILEIIRVTSDRPATNHA
jgi:hypothetical protein